MANTVNASMVVPGDYAESGAEIVDKITIKSAGLDVQAECINTLQQKLRTTMVSDSGTGALPIITQTSDVARYRPKNLSRDGWGNICRVYAYVNATRVSGAFGLTIIDVASAAFVTLSLTSSVTGWVEVTNSSQLTMTTTQEYVDLEFSTSTSGTWTQRDVIALAIVYDHGAVTILPAPTSGTEAYSWSGRIPFDLDAFAHNKPVSSYWQREMHRALEQMYEHRTGNAWAFSQPVNPILTSAGTVQSISPPPIATSLRCWFFITTEGGGVTVTTPAGSASVSAALGWVSLAVAVNPGEINDVVVTGATALFDSSSAYYIDGVL
jgi:hypothetical protein